MRAPFADRTEAGRALGRALRGRWPQDPPLVLGLPRGGVPVAAQVAAELGASLDVLVVRKLGLPTHPELAMGAIASGGIRVLNPQVLSAYAISGDVVEQVAAVELAELERRECAFRGARARPALAGRIVVLVDDGLATGATVRAAVQAVRTAGPQAVVVAVPVGAPAAVQLVGDIADDVVCLHAPRDFRAVGSCYGDFAQTSDDEVRRLLG